MRFVNVWVIKHEKKFFCCKIMVYVYTEYRIFIVFPCDGCGICCRNISAIPLLAFFHNGEGVCTYLTKDNKCMVYDKRPEICRIDTIFEKYYKNIYSKEEFYKLNLQICTKLKGERSCI